MKLLNEFKLAGLKAARIKIVSGIIALSMCGTGMYGYYEYQTSKKANTNKEDNLHSSDYNSQDDNSTLNNITLTDVEDAFGIEQEEDIYVDSSLTTEKDKEEEKKEPLFESKDLTKDNKEDNKDDTLVSKDEKVAEVPEVFTTKKEEQPEEPPVVPSTENTNDETPAETTTTQEDNNDDQNNNQEYQEEHKEKKKKKGHWEDWEYYDDYNEIRYWSNNDDKYEYRDHSWGEFVYRNGQMESTCSTCGHVRVRAHEHDFGPWIDNGTNEIRYCNIDNSHVEYQNHSMGDTYYDASIGQSISICSSCGHVEYLGHEHSWGDWIDNGTNEIRYCNIDNSHVEYQEHVMGDIYYDEGSSKNIAVCQNCGHVEYYGHEHEWGQWQDNGSNEIRYCNIDNSHVEYQEHVMGDIYYDEGSSKNIAVCQNCGHVEYYGHEHEWGQWQDNSSNEIRYCNLDNSHVEYQDHVMGDIHYDYGEEQDIAICQNCGHVEYYGHEHDWSDWESDGDCETRYCLTDDRHTESRDHAWANDWEYVGEGQDEDYCTSCGKYRYRNHQHVNTYTETRYNLHEPNICYAEFEICEDCGHGEMIEGTEVEHNWVDGVCEDCDMPQPDYSYNTQMLENMKADLINYLKYQQYIDMYDDKLLAKGEKTLTKNMRG